MTAPHRESQPGTAGANWTPEQFWEYADGLLGTHVRDQMRDRMAERGLAIVADLRTPSPAGVREALIPPAKPQEAEGGWRIDVAWLSNMQAEVEKTTGYGVTLECVEEIVLRTASLKGEVQP